MLVPNSELGHLEIDGHDAESRAAYSAMERESLSWEKWAKRLQRYYSHVEFLFSPDLFIVGGGVSKHHEHFLPLLDPDRPAVTDRASGARALATDARPRSVKSRPGRRIDGAHERRPREKIREEQERRERSANARSRGGRPLDDEAR